MFLIRLCMMGSLNSQKPVMREGLACRWGKERDLWVWDSETTAREFESLKKKRRKKIELLLMDGYRLSGLLFNVYSQVWIIFF